MEGNKNDTKDGDKTLENSMKENKVSIFSQEEIEGIVREFISAYIRGDLEIIFMSAEEIMQREKISGRRLHFDTAISQEIEYKKPILDEIEICAGTKQATSEQRYQAINELFGIILHFRSSSRLKGKFMTFDVEKRVSKLENDLDETNKLLAELLITVQSLLSGRKP